MSIQAIPLPARKLPKVSSVTATWNAVPEHAQNSQRHPDAGCLSVCTSVLQQTELVHKTTLLPASC